MTPQERLKAVVPRLLMVTHSTGSAESDHALNGDAPKPPPDATVFPPREADPTSLEDADDDDVGLEHVLDGLEGAGAGDGDGDGKAGGWWKNRFLARLTAVAGLGGLMFGWDTGVCAGVLVSVGSDLGHALSPAEQELLVSATTVGAIFGALAAGRLSDWIGRKMVLVISSVFFLLGAVEQSAANILKEIIVGRVIVGLGVGLASVVVPIYLAEISPPSVRGQIVSLNVVLVTGGQVAAYVLDSILYHVPHGWRWMVLAGGVPAIAQMVGLYRLHESPRWDIANDRVDHARNTLSLIFPEATPAQIDRQIELVQRSLHGRGTHGGIRLHERTGKLRLLFREPSNRKALMIACMLQLFQQATGFNSLMYYSSKVLQMAGFESNPNTAAIGVALANWIGTIVALKYIDRVGRRRMLLWTLVGMMIGLFFLGLSFQFIHLRETSLDTKPPSSPEILNSTLSTPNGTDLNDASARSSTVTAAVRTLLTAVRTEVEAAARSGGGGSGGLWTWICLLSMIFFCSSFALGLGNVPWLVMSEIFPNNVRGIGSGFATGTNWLANLVVAATYLHLVQAITASGTFWLYCAISGLAWIFTYHYVPDMSGMSLEGAGQVFSRNIASGEEGGPGRGAYAALRTQEDR